MAGASFSHAPVSVEKVSTKYRQIVTEVPVPESIPMLEKMYSIESHSMHGQLPVVWDRAEGFQVYDAWGNRWIDFTSTIFVANAGHGNKRIVNALRDLLEKPLLHTYTYATSERVDYLEYLIANTPDQFEKAFLLSAGTEATEAALKLMRLNGISEGKSRQGIVCFEGAFHGRTMGAQMMTGNEGARAWIGYQDPNIFHLPFPYPWIIENDDPAEFFLNSMQNLLDEHGLDPATDLCGLMLETFQGWGAVFYPEAYVQAAVSFAREHGILVAFDEMQAGFGRTGELFGYSHYGVEPDLLCCGKGVSSGLPLAFVLGSQKVMDLPDIGSMSSTHSANPLCCTAGHANLKAMIEDDLVGHSRELGRKFHELLNGLKEKYPDQIKYVFGKGLLAAIIFMGQTGSPLSSLCDRICELAMQRGLLLVHTGRESIKLAPPLCIEEDALVEGINVLATCIQDAVAEQI